MASRKSPLPGSGRTPLPGARVVGPVDPDERFEVTVRVRARAKSRLLNVVRQLGETGKGRHLTREEFEKAHGAEPADLNKVARFAKQHKLTIVEQSISRRSIVLSGKARDFSTAFGVRLARYEHSGGTYRGRTGSVKVPSELQDIIEGVFGLDNRLKPNRICG